MLLGPKTKDQRPKTKDQRRLLAREVIHRRRALEERVIPRDHGNAGLGYEVALPIRLGVITDDRALGDLDVAIDDRAADPGVASDVYMSEDDAGLDFGVGVHANVG